MVDLDEVNAMLDEAAHARGGPADVVERARPPWPQPLDLRGLRDRRAPPREWLIDQWLPRSSPVLIAGPGGGGKSLLVQQVATAQALQHDFIGRMEHSPRVMVWSCEDDADELWRRQEAISAHFGVSLDAVADRLELVSRNGCDNTLFAPLAKGVMTSTPVFDLLREQVNDLGVSMLWLDNVAHCYAGNPDDRYQVTTFINAMMGMVKGRPWCPALTTHTARAEGSEYAGSAAWENACRARWFFGPKLPGERRDRDDEPVDDSVRYLARRKSNYSARDHVRMTLQDGALVPDQAPGHVGGLVAALDERKAEEVALAGFRTLLDMGVTTTDAKNSPSYLPKQIVEKGLSAGYRREDLGRAVNRLMGRGMFVRGPVGVYGNRNTKEGLKLTPEGEALCTK